MLCQINQLLCDNSKQIKIDEVLQPVFVKDLKSISDDLDSIAREIESFRRSYFN